MGIPFCLLCGMNKNKKTKKPKSFQSCENPSELLPSSMSVASNSITDREELEYFFRTFDSDGDGKISSSELGSILGKLGDSATEEKLQRTINEADIDGDGFINLNEFIEMNKKGVGVDSGKVLEYMRNAFLIFDMDGIGSISPEDLQSAYRSLGLDFSIQECLKMLSGDEAIQFQKFLTIRMRSGSKR